jgi:hypothetical protein
MTYGTHNKQVNLTSHTHNYMSGAGNDSTTPLFSSIPGSLIPQPPGQDGPTLDQLLARGTKAWRPYSSDEEMRSALADWKETVTATLAKGGAETDTTRLIRLLDYITQTREYVDRFGHRLTYDYHKRAIAASNKRPPLYDPITGSTYWPAYHEVLSAPGSSSASRTSYVSQPRQSSRKQKTVPPTKPAKRSRAEGHCEVHPNSSHTNGDCNQQRQNKRPNNGKQAEE